MSSSPSPVTAATVPFAATTTPAIERANRLISVRSNPGFLDIIRISEDLVKNAYELAADSPAWDPNQIVLLKARMQAAKEHHELLFAKILEAIRAGVEEASAKANELPSKTVEEILEQGDYVRQEVLRKFDDMDLRPAGSYEKENS